VVSPEEFHLFVQQYIPDSNLVNLVANYVPSPILDISLQDFQPCKDVDIVSSFVKADHEYGNWNLFEYFTLLFQNYAQENFQLILRYLGPQCMLCHVDRVFSFLFLMMFAYFFSSFSGRWLTALVWLR
jgi:hypothetical protein